MPTILDLFKGSPQDLAVSATDNSSKSGFVKSVKNFVDQETSGIRIKSLVEINNPLIYGTGTIRIANRSIETTELQKSSTTVPLFSNQTPSAAQNSTSATQGLTGTSGRSRLGAKLSEARDAVTSKLGLPQNLIPSRVVSNTEYFGKKGGEQMTIDSLEKIIQAGQGSGFGKFLKSTGGGNPQTVGKQAVGQGIGLVKDELRKQAFGKPQTIGQLTGQPLETQYSSIQTYSNFNSNGARSIYTEGGDTGQSTSPFSGIPGVPQSAINDAIQMGNSSTDKVDLKLVSPIYGLERKGNDAQGKVQNRFGTSKYAYQFLRKKGEVLPQYDPTKPYTENTDKNTYIDVRRQFNGEGDGINLKGPNDDYSRKDMEGLGLIPFWVSGLDASKPVYFRAILSGISEQISPSWSDSNFLGNPYKYYTYSGVERSVTFTLKMYCNNPTELAKNWEKLEYLTSKTYPSVPKGESYFNAPFIKFRLGDIYYEKVAFIESLTYTVDDNSNWETDIEGFLLPKLIDVQATFKFVEWEGTELALYNYGRGEDAIKSIKEKRETYNDNRLGLSVGVERVKLEPVNSLGASTSEPPVPRSVNNGKSGLDKGIKNASTGETQTTPKSDKENDNNSNKESSIVPETPPKYEIVVTKRPYAVFVEIHVNGFRIQTHQKDKDSRPTEVAREYEKIANTIGFIDIRGDYYPPSENVTKTFR